MKAATLTALENLFLALSDRTRLRLLALMAGGEVSVGYLAEQLGESQPKTSRHLAYLRNAGLVSARRDGKWIYYNIQPPKDPTAAGVLSATIGPYGYEDTMSVRADTPREWTIEASAVYDADNIYDEAYATPFEPNDLEIFML
jgi:ArsR family transcriptional regulator